MIVVDVGQAEGLGVVDEHGVREHDGKEAEPQLQSKELKVLSSEMDPDKIRFIWKAFIKEMDAEVSRKSARLQSFESTSKIQHHLVQLFEIRKWIANVGVKFIAPEG